MAEEEEEKTMKQQAQDEWAELMVENIETLIPDEWNERLNNVILPAVLKFMKMGLKYGISNSHKMLGENKMAILMNFPIVYAGKNVSAPCFVKIDKSQLKNEMELKDGENPETFISYLDIYTRIDSFTNVKDLMKAVKDGTLMKGLVIDNPKEKIENIIPQLPEGK